MGAASRGFEAEADVIAHLQGVWFPTHMTLGSESIRVYEPAFPAPRDGPWLMTVIGGTLHITQNAEYYATGGRLRVFPADGRLTVIYPLGLPEEPETRFAYRLVGDELYLRSGGFVWSGPFDDVGTTKYNRVAPAPTREMMTLIESAMRGWPRHGDAA